MRQSKALEREEYVKGRYLAILQHETSNGDDAHKHHGKSERLMFAVLFG